MKPLPEDHEERMRVMRRMAQWELGDPSWAGLLMQAYLDPEWYDQILNDEGAE